MLPRMRVSRSAIEYGMQQAEAAHLGAEGAVAVAVQDKHAQRWRGSQQPRELAPQEARVSDARQVQLAQLAAMKRRRQAAIKHVLPVADVQAAQRAGQLHVCSREVHAVHLQQLQPGASCARMLRHSGAVEGIGRQDSSLQCCGPQGTAGLPDLASPSIGPPPACTN